MRENLQTRVVGFGRISSLKMLKAVSAMKDFGNGARILDAGAEKASKSQGDSARGVLTEMAGTTKGILTLTGSARWRTQSIWSALLFCYGMYRAVAKQCFPYIYYCVIFGYFR